MPKVCPNRARLAISNRAEARVLWDNFNMDNTIAPPVVARGVATEQNLYCAGAMAWALLALYIAERVVTSLREKAHATNVTLTCHASDGIPPVLADPVQIEVVVRNLVMNAIDSATQASPSRGIVEVT